METNFCQVVMKTFAQNNVPLLADIVYSPHGQVNFEVLHYDRLDDFSLAENMWITHAIKEIGERQCLKVNPALGLLRFEVEGETLQGSPRPWHEVPDCMPEKDFEETFRVVFPTRNMGC